MEFLQEIPITDVSGTPVKFKLHQVWLLTEPWVGKLCLLSVSGIYGTLFQSQWYTISG